MGICKVLSIMLATSKTRNQRTGIQGLKAFETRLLGGLGQESQHGGVPEKSQTPMWGSLHSQSHGPCSSQLSWKIRARVFLLGSPFSPRFASLSSLSPFLSPQRKVLHFDLTVHFLKTPRLSHSPLHTQTHTHTTRSRIYHTVKGLLSHYYPINQFSQP